MNFLSSLHFCWGMKMFDLSILYIELRHLGALATELSYCRVYPGRRRAASGCCKLFPRLAARQLPQ